MDRRLKPVHAAQAFEAGGVALTRCGARLALGRVSALPAAVTCRLCRRGFPAAAKRAARAAALAMALGCAHVEVDAGRHLEIHTLGAVEVAATSEGVAVKGAGISSALARVAAALIGLFP